MHPMDVLVCVVLAGAVVYGISVPVVLVLVIREWLAAPTPDQDVDTAHILQFPSAR